MVPAVLRSKILWTGIILWVGGITIWAIAAVADPRFGGSIAATFGAFVLAGKLAAIPTGLSLGLPAFIVALTILVADVGTILVAYPLTMGGLELLGKWSKFVERQKHRAREASKDPKGFLARYGSWALFTLSLAPVGFYSPLAVSAIGQAMGLSARRVLTPVIAASVLMTGVLTWAFGLGLDAIAQFDRRLPFLVSTGFVLSLILFDLVRRRVRARRARAKTGAKAKDEKVETRTRDFSAMARSSATAKKSASKATTPKKVKAAGPQGRPRAAKADGNAPVQAYIDALQGWKKDVAKKFDTLVGREVPNVRRAIKWSSPMYGIEGQGWFAAFGVFSKKIKINFFRGVDLKPVPPEGEGALMRSVDVAETDTFNDKRIAQWVRQAAKLPGWGKN